MCSRWKGRNTFARACLDLRVLTVNMLVSSTKILAANWLLLCLINPLCSATDKSPWIPPEIEVPARFRLTKFEAIPLQEGQNRESSKNESDAHLVPLDPNDEEARKRNEEIMKKMSILNRMLLEDTDKSDVESMNTIEDDNIITEAGISEEAKRVVRQVRRQRPGFFWTLARLTFETFNDTRSALQQISNIVNQNIEMETTTRSAIRTNPLMLSDARTITPSGNENNASSSLESVNATTTTTMEPPFKFTRNGLQDLIRKNVRGLVRLFNIEWQDALNQSEVNVREFQKDLGNQVGGFLQDNPNAYPK